MYSDYFKLNEPPFSLTPDPRYMFMSERHREGLAHLLYGIQQAGGFVQLTGEVGSGKTTLCRCLVRQLPPDTDIALILNPRLTALELLASICDELRVPYPPETKSIKVLVDALNQRLLEAHAQRRRTVLIIDEAQNLHSEVLEQIRLLTNLETSQEKLLQVILIGQPELLWILRQKKLRQLAQRVTARYHLLSLSRRETYAYVRHRLLVAGRHDPLFTAPAMRGVYRLSGGVPRLINIICDRALLGAYALDRQRVTAAMVRRAYRETRGVVVWYRRLRPAWTVAIALMAALAVGSAVFLGTPRFRRDAAAIGSSARAFVATRLSRSAQPAKTFGGVASVQQPARSIGGTTLRIEDPPARTGGGSSASLLHTGVPIEAPKADLNAQPTTRDSNAAPAASRLSDILVDPALRGNSASSFVTLYSKLGITVPLNESDLGCKAGADQGFGCMFRVGNWTKLRYYDLPAILELTLPSGLQHRVTLVGLEDETATLAIGGREYGFPLSEIDRVWDGSFILLWKLPFASRQISPGDRGQEVIWVRQALDTLEGKASAAIVSDVYDEALRRRVIAFQRDRSLPQDGLVGNATLVRLTLALMGRNAPSISRHAR